MKSLILAEKPSVAKNIADALKIKSKKDGYFEGDRYIITWAFGHLLQLLDAKDYEDKMKRWKMENFPFFPEQFRYKVKSNPRNREQADSGAKKQLTIIYNLMKRQDITSIISACDFDREGQIIGDTIIYNLRTDKEVYRILLNEWTEEEVLRGFNQMIPNDKMKPLQDAGISRQWADWIIGINLTSVATLKYQKGSGKALNIGRVLLPTLKIIYDRDKEIKNFVPEAFFKLTVLFKTEEGAEYEGTYEENEEVKFKNKDNLELIKDLLEVGKQGFIFDKQVNRKNEYPPLLFNLSNLQGYMTSKYNGWTSEKVLKVAQSLYEKKFITYPRTASVALEESLVDKAAKVLHTLKQGLPYEDKIKFSKSKRVFNNANVDGHSAIMPTYLRPKSLSKDETLVYEAIKNRFIMQFMPIAVYEETKLITKIKDEEIKGFFQSKGKVQIVEGWKVVEKVESKETILPAVDQKELVEVVLPTLSSHMTTPPKPHTEKSLLRIMETCGKKYGDEDSGELMDAILTGFSIGTPATRAETIKKLKDVGYIKAEKKNLVCTDLGRKLVDTFPIKDLFDLEFTGRLEKTLSDIEKGKKAKSTFLQFIFDFTSKAVEEIKVDQEIIINEISMERSSAEVLGNCPLCGGQIVEGKKGFGCRSWKSGCKFVIWKNDKFLASMKKRPTKTMVKTLLKNGIVPVKGLVSKNGNKFNAKLKYKKNENNEYFSWEMEF